jgi:frataxin-like iron-binding protein CyaY
MLIKILKKFFKYLILIILALVVAKWIIMFLLSSNNETNNINTETEIKTLNNTKHKEIKEVELSMNFESLKPKIEQEYQKTQQDIYNYIDKQINKQRKESKYRLTKEDGFLDWIFDYFTGWKIVYKKVKGFFGSEDNEKKMVINKFKNDVINPGLNETLKNINNYTQERINDYYKNVITITVNYINKNIEELKEEGYSDIKIDKNSIPWASVITARGGDAITITEATGLTGIGIVVGKFVGSKVATLIGPKVLGLVEAKVATIIAGKIAAAFEFILAPIIDYGANEAVKMAKYDDTKKEFEEVIDNIFDELDNELKNSVKNSLIEVKNEIYTELNRETKISAKKEIR